MSEFSKTQRRTGGDTSWFVRDRFGLFIHWGLYAMGARHEWLRHRERVTDEQYAVYFKHFDPDLYDPTVWADAAADAGMKYFVVTAKHHEGFCLWDSAYTDYKSTRTPAGRDLLKPMVEAFRARGLRTGFYYSLLDWHHPQFVLDSVNGPYRDHPDRAKMNQGRDQAKYAAYIYNQTRELLTKFGTVDVLWYDFSYPGDRSGPESGKGREDWQSEKLYQLIRQLQPNVLLDDRLDLPGVGDFQTPEQLQPRQWPTVDGVPVVWEACQTMADSWGYHRDEEGWRSPEQLIQTLIDCVSKGGNLLLNVGPTGRGELDERALSRLGVIGRWMKRHGRSIYGCTQAPHWIKAPQDCRLTYNPEKKALYVHLLVWPYKHLYLDGLGGKVEYGQLLNDASEIRLSGDAWHARHMSQPADVLTITLPQRRPDVTVPVLELFLK